MPSFEVVSDLSPQRLASLLQPGSIGTPFQYLALTDSTQLRARSWEQQGVPHGAVVLADEQSKGRGRWGRSWEGGRGLSLLASFIFRLPLLHQKVGLLGGAVATALCLAIRDETQLPAQTKWPNDVWINQKKGAGILIEQLRGSEQGMAFIVGLGVNVNQSFTELPPLPRLPATSLAIETGQPWDRGLLLARLCAQLDESLRLLLTQPHALIERWESVETTLGKEVQFTSAEKLRLGVARRILADGSLEVESEGATWNLRWGDVTLTPLQEPGNNPPYRLSTP
jgi:BirA family biotin operon repressor/biotin-[acetyl-CoA-carboxylase] ligase